MIFIQLILYFIKFFDKPLKNGFYFIIPAVRRAIPFNYRVRAGYLATIKNVQGGKGPRNFGTATTRGRLAGT
jgi:hypothetical protein